jgi:hypothetical protein
MKFHLDTDYPIASDSNDHLHPLGTKNNRKWEPFNWYLFKLFDGVKPSTLEFGCAGGAQVKSLMDDGCLAFGLEGSDYNQVCQSGEWGVIPDNLFTCDLGHPFTLSNGDGKPYQFDVITAWEFIEHLPEERLPAMMDNIKRHLKLGGYFIGSSTSYSSSRREIQYHQTGYELDWWEALFKRHGFIHRTDIMQGFDYAYAWVRRIDFNFVFKKIG